VLGLQDGQGTKFVFGYYPDTVVEGDDGENKDSEKKAQAAGDDGENKDSEKKAQAAGDDGENKDSEASDKANTKAKKDKKKKKKNKLTRRKSVRRKSPRLLRHRPRPPRPLRILTPWTWRSLPTNAELLVLEEHNTIYTYSRKQS
jgi:hypothetical protein